jgi:hypothetical protein
MTLTEGKHTAEFVVSQAPGTLSVDAVTIVLGQDRKAGDVMGKITASGKYKIYDNAAVDGSEVAAGILWGDVDATAADKPGTLLERLAEVRAADLGWNGQAQPAIDAGLADLLAKNIKAR